MNESTMTSDQVRGLITDALGALWVRLETLEEAVFGKRGPGGGGGGIGAALSALEDRLKALTDTVAAHGTQMSSLNQELEEAIRIVAELKGIVNGLSRGRANEGVMFA